MSTEPSRSLCALLLGLLVSPLSWADDFAWSLERLMAQFAGIEHRESRFIETRELALLNNSLESTGTLSFDAPDSLRKSYDPPSSLSYEITGNRLTLRKADGSLETVLLDNAPLLLAYIASLRAVLAGDQTQLNLYFDPHLSGTQADWLLSMVPRDPQLAGQVLRLEIIGRQAEIEQFIVIEQGGDRIITRLQAPSEK